MKTISKILILSWIISLFILGCKKEESSSSSTGSLSGNTINGKIEAWTMGSDKILKAYDNGGAIIGTTTISSDGSFNLVLDTPSTHDALGVNVPAGVKISDPTAEIANLRNFKIRDNSGLFNGTLSYGNNLGFEVPGSIGVSFCHLTKNTTINGSFTDSTFNETIDINFKAGWNVRVYQISSVDPIIQIKFTSSVPSSAKWYFSAKK